MDPEELKRLIEDQGKAWSEYRRVNDERLSALEKGKGTAELDAKLARIDADLTAYGKSIEAMSKAQADFEKRNLGGGPIAGGKSEAIVAFGKWARSRSGEAFRNQATTDFDPGGGYTVVPEIETSIDRIATKNSAFRPLARITSISSAAYKELVGQGGATGGWVGERDSRDETDTPKLEQIEITAEEQYAEPAASQDLLDDSGIDIAAWLAEEVGITLAEKEAEAFISGNGVKKPRGILSYPMVANANYVWGKIGFVKSGHDGALDPATGGDVLIDLIHGLKAKYRANGTFLANDLTIAEIRKLKTDTGYLWQPSLQAGQPSLLLGYPIQSDDFMPDLAADSYSLAFADFNSAYRIVDRQGIKVLQDPYTKKGFVLFYTTRRVGGGIRNFEAIKFLKFGD